MLAYPQQLNYCSNRLLRTNGDWVHPFNFLANCNFLQFLCSIRWNQWIFRIGARKRDTLLLYGCLAFSSYMRQLIVSFRQRGSGNSASLSPKRTSLCKAANTVKFVSCRITTLCLSSLQSRTRWRQFCWEYRLALSSHPLCTQVSIDPAGSYYRVRKITGTFHLLHSSE